MGEYATTTSGDEIKIGTCEDCYYLRADQRPLVNYSDGWDGMRFRFPFPDEDGIAPGHFDDHDRGERIPGAFALPADFEHTGSVQFRAEPGYLLSLPCPESFPAPEGGHADRQSIVDGTSIPIGRNGWSGGYRVSQQREIDGELWTVVACGSCRSKWRLPREIAATVAEAFIEEAERTEWRRVSSDWDEAAGRWGDSCSYGWEAVHSGDSRAYLLAMASRILAGYTREEVPA